MWQVSKVSTPNQHVGLRALLLSTLATGLFIVLFPPAAWSTDFSSVDPVSISAGSFYNGATVRVHGSIGERSQVVIRVIGPLEHHTFNRRAKIGGIIWGGVEHVTFRDAPSLYAVFSSAALAATADRALRIRLQLGYEWFSERIAVEGTRIEKQEMIAQFVRLKESEGLYRLAPGAVHILDTENGRRRFEVAMPLPAATPPGRIEVAVIELTDGSVIGEEIKHMKLERVGMPAFLHSLAHEHGTLFGLLAILVLATTGLFVDFVECWKTTGQQHPAIVGLTAFAHGVGEVFLNAHRKPRTGAEVERLHEKYKTFRKLLTLNNEILELLAEVEEESSWTSFRHPRIRMGIRALFDGTADMVGVLNKLTENRYFDLANVISSVRADVTGFLENVPEHEDSRLTLQLRDVNIKTAALAGGKAVNLARIECDLGLHVPGSFVVTTEAYREFLEIEGLAGKLRTVLAPARLDMPDDFRRRCELAQGLVEQTCVPAAVVEAILNARRNSGIPEAEGLAVRSSASGEDSELSFAGQFETVLNVPQSGLPDAWRRVVFSRFSPRAVFYRRVAGLAEVDTPMAVLMQRMVRARASGVLFTRRPDDPRSSVLLITAVRGLGPEASAGVASADEFVLSRSSPHRILDRRIARKSEHLVGAAGGGLAQLKVTVDEQMQASISEQETIQLAKTGLEIERYFGSVAQDIEWAIDVDGQTFVLQARPLRTMKQEGKAGDIPRDAPLLLRGGEPVWTGRAVGPVHVARSPGEEEETPTGAVLVVPQLLPDCVRVIPRVCGIIVERGTVTGHAASLVREFRVPCLFGIAGALDTLVPGAMVSLDVASRSVFAGVLWPELRGHLPVTLLGHRTVGLPDGLAGKLTKLSGSSFMGTWACQSLHDVIRYAHEMAIQSMFDIGDLLLDSTVGGVKRLDSPLEFYMHIVDLGGGIRPEALSQRTVKPEDVVCIPFRGLWRGLGNSQFEPQHPEAPSRSFGSVVMATMRPGPRELGSPNYACITDNYLNLNSRQAYHFAIVDSYLSNNQNNNHISFRLKGGGAAPWQRELRAHFVAEVLRFHHFTLNVTGDLVNGWVRGVDLATGTDELAMIGHLLRFLARLDMRMANRSDVKMYTDAFVESEAALAAKGADGGKAPGDPDCTSPIAISG
jgi:pyruvate,water dikinase